MRHPLRHSVSILLAMALLIGILTVIPVGSAGAAAVTDDAWIFAANDGRTYDLDGKWVRFGDEDFQLSGTGEFTLTQRTTYIYQLKYGTTRIADSRSIQAGPVNIGNTFYVTGQGTEDHPYIFTPNMLFYKTGVTIANGGTVAMGYENEGFLPNTNNGVAVPGDGFKGASRMLVGAGSSVEFAEHSEQLYQPYNNTAYIGVSEAGQYGWRIYSSSITNGYGFDFAEGNDTLYYTGRDSSDVYHFTENPSLKTGFSGTNKVICTVTWENQDGTKLRTMTYNLGDTADDGGLTPAKAADAAYTYSFTGFEPAYEPLTDDMTYVATYEATPKGPMTYSVNAWIFPTDDGKVYDELAGMCYSYNGGEATGFTEGGSFSVADNQILLCGVAVADIDTSASYKRTFADTVYVTGNGSPEDPFVFHPNYIYADTAKTNVKDGVSVSVDSDHTGSGDKAVANPGDGFKAMSRIRVGNEQVRFMQQLGYYTASRNLLGVGETTYGYRYSKTKALPFSFVSGDHTLYYFEKSDSGIYQFSETKPPLRNTFSPSESTIYTVTWKDDNGSVLDTETYYVGVRPTFKKAEPSKSSDDDYHYSFSGWTPAISSVTADAVYTATYSRTERLFRGHSLTLDGDIGLNFYLNVTPEQIHTGEGVVVSFERTVAGKTITSSCKLNTSDYITRDSKTYYKATCRVPAAEMTYNIHATASIDGVLQEETDDYRVKDYGLKILSDPASYTPDGKDSDALANLVKAMLDYGAKAQTAFSRTEVELANTGIDYSMTQIDYDTIPVKKSDMSDGVSAYGLEYYGTTVVFLTQTTLRHYYRTTGGAVSDAVKAAALASGFEYGEKSGFVYFEKKDISADQLDTVQRISFDGTNYYDFSVLDYSRQVLQSSNMTEADKQLAMATYWYNRYADAYFA